MGQLRHRSGLLHSAGVPRRMITSSPIFAIRAIARTKRRKIRATSEPRSIAGVYSSDCGYSTSALSPQRQDPPGRPPRPARLQCVTENKDGSRRRKDMAQRTPSCMASPSSPDAQPRPTIRLIATAGSLLGSALATSALEPFAEVLKREICWGHRTSYLTCDRNVS